MEIISEVIDLLNNGNVDEVIAKIESFLDENPQYKTVDYYHFANPIEETLFDVYVGDISKIKKLGLDEPLDELYMFLAIAYMLNGNVELAEKYMLSANRINPVSADILMRLCEIYQQKHEEEKLKSLSEDIFKYTYDRQILVSNYFKYADYLYHAGGDMELYDHLFNLFMYFKAGESQMPISENIRYFKDNDFKIGFNVEIVKILLYLYDVYSKQGMANAADYFKNILDDVIEFNEHLRSLAEGG